MDYLRSAGFGGLFAVTFVVSAVFQTFAALALLLLAALSPQVFQMNGAPAQSSLQAIGVALFLWLVGMAANTVVSATGAGLWLLVRRVLPLSRAAP